MAQETRLYGLFEIEVLPGGRKKLSPSYAGRIVQKVYRSARISKRIACATSWWQYTSRSLLASRKASSRSAHPPRRRPSMSNQVAIVTEPNAIRYIQFCAQLGAARLEAIGLRHSSGRSIHAMLKRTYNLKGNRAKVLAQLEAIKSTWSQQLERHLDSQLAYRRHTS